MWDFRLNSVSLRGLRLGGISRRGLRLRGVGLPSFCLPAFKPAKRITITESTAAKSRTLIISPGFAFQLQWHTNRTMPAPGGWSASKTVCAPGTQPAIDLDGASIVAANGKKRAVSAGANALHQGLHQRGCVAAAFMAGKRGHRGDLAIAGNVQPQSAHRHQLFFFANAEEYSQLLYARAQRPPRTRCRIHHAHLRNVGRRELHDLRINDLRRGLILRFKVRRGRQALPSPAPSAVAPRRAPPPSPGAISAARESRA